MNKKKKKNNKRNKKNKNDELWTYAAKKRREEKLAERWIIIWKKACHKGSMVVFLLGIKGLQTGSVRKKHDSNASNWFSEIWCSYINFINQIPISYYEWTFSLLTNSVWHTKIKETTVILLNFRTFAVVLNGLSFSRSRSHEKE